MVRVSAVEGDFLPLSNWMQLRAASAPEGHHRTNTALTVVQIFQRLEDGVLYNLTDIVTYFSHRVSLSSA